MLRLIRLMLIIAAVATLSVLPVPSSAQSSEEICSEAWATLDYLQARRDALQSLDESNQRIAALNRERSRPTSEAWQSAMRSEIAARDEIVRGVIDTAPPAPYQESHAKLAEGFLISYDAAVQDLEATLFADRIQQSSEVAQLQRLSDEVVRLTRAGVDAIEAAINLSPELPSDEELEPCRVDL